MLSNFAARSIFRITAASLAFVLTGCVLALAQNAPPKPTWTLITTYKVRPDMRTEFENIQKEYTAAYKQANAGRTVWNNFFGDLDEFTVVVQPPDFAAFDGPSPIVKALGQEKADALGKRLFQTITDAHRTICVERPDLSIMAGKPELLPFAVISYAKPAPGRLEDHINWLKNELLPALKQGGIKQSWAYEVIFGENPGYIAVTPIPNMAMLDQGHPAWKMQGGKAAADKMFARGAATMVGSNDIVARYLPDLSYFPAPSTAAQ